MTFARDGLLLGAAALAGAVNSVAGGGTLLSFPAALAWGLPGPMANATNALAMSPGSFASAWAYRRELRGARALILSLLFPTLAGGVTGAVIMRLTPERVFDAIVPWLVLGATLAILGQRAIAPRPDAAAAPPSPGRRAAAIAGQFAVGLYGGYFGAAMGIVMLAVLALIAPGDIHHRNAVKNLLSALINGVASIYFAFAGLIDPRAALLMLPGALAGGFIGAQLARRASARLVRGIVVAIGLGLTALLAYRAYVR
jgi:uncharacterized membrane protein YfcA